MVTQLAWCGMRRLFDQPPPLLWGQPVPKPNAQAPHAFDTTNAGGQLWTQQTGISCLVRDTADGCQPKISSGRGVLALFEVDPITEDDSTVERETRLGAVSGDKLTDRVMVRPLAAGGRQAAEHGGTRRSHHDGGRPPCGDEVARSRDGSATYDALKNAWR